MITGSTRRAAAALALAAAFAVGTPAQAGGSPEGGGGIDFPGLAADFRARRPGASLEEVLAQHYVVAHLGSFDLYYPADRVAKKGEPDELKRSVSALMDLQAGWIELFDFIII